MLRLFILFLLSYSALAQPGIPPCWLMADACLQHPHNHFQPDQADEKPHDHGYLFDSSAGLAVDLPASSHYPAALLIALLGLSTLSWRILSQQLSASGWRPPPEPRPPCTSPSFSNQFNAA